jgi:DNA-binding beta-propeller fold protein YncE
MRCFLPLLLLLLLIACATTSAHPPAAAPAAELRGIALPGADSGAVMMDYLAYDRAHRRVWVPAGNTGSVDVIDVDSDRVTRIDGFPTQEIERKGKKRTVGPSSAAVGEQRVYVGNRGDFSVCAIDPEALKIATCVKLESMPDALIYIGSTKEVWATTPRDKSIVILDAAALDKLVVKSKISLEGEPEGFALDDARGVFYTNLEDKDRTLAIEIKSRQIAHDWAPSCGEDGPKGLRLDHAQNLLFVACADRVKALDAGHDGKELSALETGAGVDDIDYLEPKRQLFVGAAGAGKLTVVRVDEHGALVAERAVSTASGARNAVVTDDGTAYLTDSPEGKILVVRPAR